MKKLHGYGRRSDHDLSMSVIIYKTIYVWVFSKPFYVWVLSNALHNICMIVPAPLHSFCCNKNWWEVRRRLGPSREKPTHFKRAFDPSSGKTSLMICNRPNKCWGYTRSSKKPLPLVPNSVTYHHSWWLVFSRWTEWFLDRTLLALRERFYAEPLEDVIGYCPTTSSRSSCI